MSEPTGFNLLRRSNGIWYVLYAKEGRIRWKSTRSRSKQGALKTLSSMKDLLRFRVRIVLLSNFIDEFLRFADGTYSAKTKSNYRASLGNLESFVGDVPLTALTPQSIDAYKADRLTKVSLITVNIELRMLKSIMNFAVRWQMLERNPFQDSLTGSSSRTPSLLLH